MEIHPAIAKRIEELLVKAKELIATQQQNLDILSKTVDLKDYFGLKSRSAEVVDFAIKLQTIASQVEALRSIPYDMATMAAEGVSPKRRSSARSMPAVNPDKNEPEEK